MIIHPTELTPSSSYPTSVPSTSPRDHIYKGKFAHRSWQQLPPELVRAIATHYLLDLQPNSYCPLAWDAKELWHPRIVYTTFRDAVALEKLMHVTPAWALALETHLFWNKACAILDPHDVLAHYQYVRPQPPLSGAACGTAPPHPQLPYRMSPFRHFRQMTARSCFVCRINSPFSSFGLAVAKRTHHTPTLGSIALCRDHRKNSFCGLCLREAPPAEVEPQFDMHGNTVRFTPYHQPYGQPTMGITAYTPYATPLNPALMVCCADNEDDETWPNVDATCRSCRSEWLWQRISSSLRDREAVGGPRFVPDSSRSASIKDRKPHSRHPPSKYASADWETRQTVDAFIDLGEGSITEVIAVAREKFWLRSQTKMPELMEQAVAATRWVGEGMSVDFPPVVPAEHASAHNPSGAHHSAVTGDVDSPDRSTSPSAPSPRSVQRSLSPSPRSAYSSEYEGSEEDEDPELLSMTEDAGGVRELAISDWARTRILDGHWCNPADQWYGYAWPAGGGVRDAGEDTESEPDPDEDVREGCTVRRTVRVEAVHPCPWTVTSSSVAASTTPTSPTSPHSPASALSNDSNGDRDGGDVHPRLSTVRAHAPPSFTLCEQAYHAYQKQLRAILLPAMRNFVRKCVMEWTSGAVGACDPGTRVARMGLEEVLAELRAPGMWFDGVDWAAGKFREGGSGRDGERDRDRDTERERDREEDSASSASSRSGGSHTTSPVLSTTTLQTTPSPPPAHEKEKDKDKEKDKSAVKGTSEQKQSVPAPPVVIPIPISPVLASPRLIHPIPYIPVTLAHMAQYSLEAFKNVWREACAPLYHCRCSICERAMVSANIAAGHAVPVPSQGEAGPNGREGGGQQQAREAQGGHSQTRGTQPAEIALEEVRSVPRGGAVQEEEEEEEDEDEDEMYEEEDEDEEEGDDEYEAEEEGEESEEPVEPARASVQLPSPHPHPHAHAPIKIAPPRMNPRKRSSDDLEEVPSDPSVTGSGNGDASKGNGDGHGATANRVGTPPKRVKVALAPGEDRAAPTKGPRATTTTHEKEQDREMLHPSATTTATPRQRKRSSEELEVGASPRSVEDKQKRIRVESDGDVRRSGSPRVSSGSASTRTATQSQTQIQTRTRTRTRTPPRGRTPPSTSVHLRSVGAGVDGLGPLKAGLVSGGELDGLYVFEET